MAEVIELILDSIAHGGEAIGRHAGKVVFVPYAIPGERVTVEVVEEKERWARARLVEVIEASPDRIEPPCPYFGPGRCGGCQWQHIAYERQANLKAQIVADQLRRLGHIKQPPVADTVILADDEGLLDYGYRNHTRFAISDDGQLAYRRAFSHDLIAVDHCPLLHEHLDELHAALDLTWPALQGLSLRAGVNTADALVMFEANSDEQPELEVEVPASYVLLSSHGSIPLIGPPSISEQVAGRLYRISAESFFQVNTTGAEALVELVAAYAGPQSEDVLLDLYCGVGLFALALAGSVREVIGIESSPSACEDFAYNAGGMGNATLHEGPAEEVLPALLQQGTQVDLVVMDPPRAGAGQPVIDYLTALHPRRIVYVSCDPATLARDGVYLIAAGYRLQEAQPVDMFPQSYHVETVALWESDGPP